MIQEEYKRRDLSLEEKVSQGIFPSKEEFSTLYFQNLTRAQICAHFGFSVSTFKKLRRLFNLPAKTHVIQDHDSYVERSVTAERTIHDRYGAKGSDTYAAFIAERRAKQQQTCLERYGVPDPSVLPELQAARAATMVERYGVDNPMKSAEIRAKASATDLERYGVPHHIVAAEVRAKSETTLLTKYGTTAVTAVPEIQAKIRATNQERYGVDCVLQNPDIKQKAYQTMWQNGSNAVLASTQQHYITNLYGGICNYLLDYYHIDCFLIEENIAVEYDGSGHDLSVRLGRETPEHFEAKERARYTYLRNRGIPVLVLKSKTDRLPPDDILLDCLQNAKQQFLNQVLYYEIDLDNLTVS